MAHEGAKTGLARSLKRRMTAAERRLWSRLRNYRFHGLRWERQEPIGRYIVDFYCSTARVVVELDGLAHSFTTRQDAARQRWLEEDGIAVLRFDNSAVMYDLGRVLSDIFEVCKGCLGSVSDEESGSGPVRE